MAAGELFDKRQALWRAAFTEAQPYAEFLESAAAAHRSRWADSLSRLALTPSQRGAVAGFTRKVNVLVLAGTWCGDCARQCPMMFRIAEASSCVDLRFMDNQANPELRDEVRVHGAARVPAAVFLSEDMLEVSRGVDRTLSAYRRKARAELGAACDAGIVPPAPEELAQEIQEWVDLFERAHLLLRVSPFLRRRHND